MWPVSLPSEQSFFGVMVCDLKSPSPTPTSAQGKQKQGRRTSTFMEFCNCKEGILLSTDVAARGLDIPSVDWIVQFDPPDEVTEYIHRVGRTARAGEGGRALLFLLPEELQFLKYLRQAKIPVNEYQFKKNKISNVQLQVEEHWMKFFFCPLSRHTRAVPPCLWICRSVCIHVCL